MKPHILLMALLLIDSAISQAAVPQTYIYRADERQFHSLEGVTEIIHHKGTDEVCIEFVNGSTSLTLPSKSVEKVTVATSAMPRLVITTPDSPNLKQIEDKEKYLDATISIEGNGTFEDMESLTNLKVKGRGNSTWVMKKKPMRLKFSTKESLLGLKKAKNFVLLANYVDPTLLRNVLAMKIGELLEIPYTNHMIPCNVLFNGFDLGCFTLTEKVGLNGSSVDDIDEDSGIMFELSTEFDEPYKFRSIIYDLPVMVKDPDFSDLTATEADERLAKWKDDFNRAEKLAHDGKAGQAFDLTSFADAYLVYQLTKNNEIGWPKSWYIVKEALGESYLYKAGPLWDFDSAYNLCRKQGDQMTYEPAEGNIWINSLLDDLCDDEAFKARYNERVTYFKETLMPQLLDFFDTMVAAMEPSAKVNGLIWPGGNDYGWQYVLGSFDYADECARLRQWLIDRMSFLAANRL